MAWALRGKNLASGTGTSVTNTHGLTISNGDLVIVTAVEDLGQIDLAIDGSGWTSVTNSPTTGNGCGQTGWCKIASSEPSSYTISNNNNTVELQVLVAVFYDDAGGTITIDDTDANSTVGDQSSLTSPTLTTDNNGLVVYSFGADTGPSAGRTVSVAPTGTEGQAWTGTGVGIGMWYETVSSGTDDNAITLNAADGINCVCVSAHFTAAGGGTTNRFLALLGVGV